MWGIEFACLLTGIRCKVRNQIFVDEAEDIIILLAVHRNLVDQLDQVADGLRLRFRILTELRQSCLQCVEDSLEDLFMRWRNQTVK